MLDATVKWLAARYPVPMVAFARYGGHVLLMLAVFGPVHGTQLWRTRHWPLQLVRGLMLGASSLLFIEALRHLPLADASALTYVAPSLVTLLAVWVLKERLPHGAWVGLGGGLLGILFIMKPGAAVFNPAALLALATACCFAVYQVLTRLLTGRDDPTRTLFIGAVVATVLVVFFALPKWTPPVNIFDAAIMALAGALGFIGHWLLVRGLTLAPASRAAPFIYIQAVVVVLMGWLVFRQWPDRWTWAGMALIVATGLFTALRQRQQLS